MSPGFVDIPWTFRSVFDCGVAQSIDSKDKKVVSQTVLETRFWLIASDPIASNDQSGVWLQRDLKVWGDKNIT